MTCTSCSILAWPLARDLFVMLVAPSAPGGARNGRKPEGGTSALSRISTLRQARPLAAGAGACCGPHPVRRRPALDGPGSSPRQKRELVLRDRARPLLCR